jgi:uncharacterized membrane protein YraQ (UPF0718 family)
MFRKLRTVYFRLLEKSGTPFQHLVMFGIGCLLFFCGMGLLFFANARLLPSLNQELVALAALSIAATGALLAAFGYIALSLIRVLRLISNNDHTTTRSRNLYSEKHSR